jgi:excinuclease UvrABC nuclease subunit
MSCFDEEACSLYHDIVSQYVAMMNKLLTESRYNFSEVSSKDVPKEQGVYVIYDKKAKAIIYAGRTKNLRRRLLGDHKRGNVEGSQFRRALKENFALRSESEITSYILENCSFQFLAIKEFEEMVRLEHFTTAILAPILNVKLKQ